MRQYELGEEPSSGLLLVGKSQSTAPEDSTVDVRMKPETLTRIIDLLARGVLLEVVKTPVEFGTSQYLQQRYCISSKYCPTCEVNLHSSCMCMSRTCPKCGSMLSGDLNNAKPYKPSWSWGDPEWKTDN